MDVFVFHLLQLVIKNTINLGISGVNKLLMKREKTQTLFNIMNQSLIIRFFCIIYNRD